MIDILYRAFKLIVPLIVFFGTFGFILYTGGKTADNAVMNEIHEIHLDTITISAHNEWNQLNFDAIYDKIIIVETNNDPQAIGDNGASYGQAQIQKAVILDVNKEFGLSLKHEDAFDAGQSRRIFKLYARWLHKYVNINTEEELVRCWNGGPTGHKKQATIKYLNKYKSL